jgi:hypothetical protein
VPPFPPPTARIWFSGAPFVVNPFPAIGNHMDRNAGYVSR